MEGVLAGLGGGDVKLALQVANLGVQHVKEEVQPLDVIRLREN